MGIVDMSSFICPCGEETAIFGTGGAEKESKNLEMSPGFKNLKEFLKLRRKETAIFGTGGAEKESKNLEMSFFKKLS